MQSFTIMVDSDCDLPRAYLDEHNIGVIPMPFNLGSQTYDDGYWQDISGKDYYNALRDGGAAGTTSVNPGAFARTFMEFAANGRELLIVVLSSGLSGTHHNATSALEEVRETYPDCRIHIIDSLSASSGCGLLASLAVQKRSEGFSAQQTADWLEEQKHKCFTLFTVDDLRFLHRGGRLSRLSAVAGSIIGVKTVLCITSDGKLKLREKVRGRKAALEMLAAQCKQSIDPDTPPETVFITHADCHEDAESLAARLRETIGIREIVIMLLGPIIGAHLGPGAVMLMFAAGMTRAAFDERFYPDKI